MATIESEKELEDFIINATTFSVDETNPLTDESIEYCFQQVEIGSYGIADIIFVDIYWDEEKPEFLIRIVELKKDLINLAAIAQIGQYKAGLEHYFKKGFRQIKMRIEGILVGSGYSDDKSCFLVDSINWLSCYHYNLSLSDGINFKESNGWEINKSKFGFLNQIAKPIKKKFLHDYKAHKAFMRRDMPVK